MSGQMMITERTHVGRDQKKLDRDLEQAHRSVVSLMTEARALTRETLTLVGYDRVNCRRLSGRPGRPRKTGTTLRRCHESRLKTVDIQEACRLAAIAIDRLARFSEGPIDQFRQQLCQELMVEASEIAGDAPLPVEQVLAITIVLARELVEIVDRFRAVLETGQRRGLNPATAEALLGRLRRRLDRTV